MAEWPHTDVLRVRCGSEALIVPRTEGPEVPAYLREAPLLGVSSCFQVDV